MVVAPGLLCEMTAEIVDACAAMLLVGRVGEQVSIMVINCEADSA